MTGRDTSEVTAHAQYTPRSSRERGGLNMRSKPTDKMEEIYRDRRRQRDQFSSRASGRQPGAGPGCPRCVAG